MMAAVIKEADADVAELLCLLRASERERLAAQVFIVAIRRAAITGGWTDRQGALLAEYDAVRKEKE